ncbi:hypothetical protein TEA_014061 [Camellia sinensis var. sinensis]|uniref:Magnesium transporter n=1 Tax=Camellia sinensis var. sinensis TaxID=542762 RepID=A0A4V3WLZ1_CAMSN|nr:hypothetical protein TEA_014061 [Camellia sinensis var. sinensis]
MGKGPFCFGRKMSRRRPKKSSQTATAPAPPSPNNNSTSAMVAGSSSKTKKKAGGAKLWMRLDKLGQSELMECDKSTIIKRVSIPARDLRILGPVFSHSSHILASSTMWKHCGRALMRKWMQHNQPLKSGYMDAFTEYEWAREKAMVVNLEFIKAIVTAEEVLLLDPLCQEVLPFVDQLRQQLPHKSVSKSQGGGQMDVQDNEMQLSSGGQWLPVPEAVEGLQCGLPFEFQVLEIALKVVCTYLDSSVADLERDAYPVLDELARNVSTKNLEHVRSLKSNLTSLLARVQKVRDEIVHLLDDNEDMAHLYLTRKWIQSQQFEAYLAGTASNSIVSAGHQLRRLSSNRSGSLLLSNHLNDHDVEDLEMLLEAYFMQLDGTRDKILSVREYIDDTEDYVNIQLDNQRNDLIELQLILNIASFAIVSCNLVSGMFGSDAEEAGPEDRLEEGVDGEEFGLEAHLEDQDLSRDLELAFEQFILEGSSQPSISGRATVTSPKDDIFTELGDLLGVDSEKIGRESLAQFARSRNVENMATRRRACSGDGLETPIPVAVPENEQLIMDEVVENRGTFSCSAEPFIIQSKCSPVLASGSAIKDPAVTLSVALALSLPSDESTFCAEPDVVFIALAAQSTILAELEKVKEAQARAKADATKVHEAGETATNELYADETLKFENRGFKHGWLKALAAANVTLEQPIPYEQLEVEPLESDPEEFEDN